MNKTRNQHKTEISSAAIYRCTNKATGDVFYMVKSDSSDHFYRLDWNGTAWMCDCPATKPCKHMRAVNEVIAAKQAAIQPIEQPLSAFELPSDTGFNMKREQEKIKAFAARARQAKIVKSWETAPLNGSRAFSLMR